MVFPLRTRPRGTVAAPLRIFVRHPIGLLLAANLATLACRVDNPAFEQEAFSRNESDSDTSALTEDNDHSSSDELLPPSATTPGEPASTTAGATSHTSSGINLSGPTTTMANSKPSDPLTSTKDGSDPTTQDDTSTSTGASQTTSTDSQTTAPTGEYQIPCPAGAISCYDMRPNNAGEVEDRGSLGKTLVFEDAALAFQATSNTSLFDYIARFEAKGGGQTQIFSWPSIGKGMGVDLWVRFKPCTSSICLVAWVKEVYVIKINQFNQMTCETVVEGKIVTTSKLTVDISGNDFKHVACVLDNDKLELRVDDSAWMSVNAKVATPLLITTSMGGVSLPVFEKTFSGDIAGLRLWNDAEALRSHF